MKKIIGLGFVIACALASTGCLKVDDKGNEKVANALAEQKTSVSLAGVIQNESTGSKAINATVKIRIGNNISESVPVTNGAFLIENLPADSNYELIVQSTTGSFLERAIFGKTRATNATGKVYEDIGVIKVAAGVEYKFSILDAATIKPIANLSFQGSSNIGSGTNEAQYYHKASYDASIQQYKIILPEKLNVGVTASLDLNRDGIFEYSQSPYSYGSGDLHLSATQLSAGVPVFLSDLHLNQKVEFRITVIDQSGAVLTGLMPSIQDSLNGYLTATYDASTQQYVFNATIGNGVTVLFPAFVAAGLKYNSAFISASVIGENISVNRDNYSLNTQAITGADKEIINVVVKPTPAIELQARVSATALDPANHGYKVFYTVPVSIKPASVHLYQKNSLNVIKGSDDATDAVAPGITLIEFLDKSIEIYSAFSLNNTLLSIEPKAPLVGGFSYVYKIDNVNLFEDANGLGAPLYEDDIEFSVASSQVFNIADVKLDNNNYHAAGVQIVAKNSAGVDAVNPNYSNGTYVYLPKSISSLKSFTMTVISFNRNNMVSASSQILNIVNNGMVNVSSVPVVSLASNESVSGNMAQNAHKGTTLADGIWYAYGLNSFDDNTNTQTNTVTFLYSFETKSGVVETSTITLPVN